MVKKALLVLLLVVVATGGVFAQTGLGSMPRNTITVDVGPTIVGLAFGQMGKLAGNFIDDMPDIKSSGFGIAAQYERQLLRPLSAALRVAYLGVGFDYVDSLYESGVLVNTSLGLDFTAISTEGHVRFYPFGSTFFLGGVVGYGGLILNASGEIVGIEQNTGQSERESISLIAPRSYVKIGARLGWRIDFGRPGGFVFEPSLGYDHAFGLGDTFGKRLQSALQDAAGESIEELSDLDDAFKILESFIFVGGPRVTLSFGWRF